MTLNTAGARRWITAGGKESDVARVKTWVGGSASGSRRRLLLVIQARELWIERWGVLPMYR